MRLRCDQKAVRVNDLWIAAIAAPKHLPVVTHHDDFEDVSRLPGVAERLTRLGYPVGNGLAALPSLIRSALVNGSTTNSRTFAT